MLQIADTLLKLLEMLHADDCSYGHLVRGARAGVVHNAGICLREFINAIASLQVMEKGTICWLIYS